MSNVTNGSLPTPAALTTWDGSTVPAAIAGLTAHTWVADATGSYHTTSDLGAEWRADYAVMLSGHAGTLTALQRMEGNAEAVFENTGIKTLSGDKIAAFREDTQKEFDAIWAAMSINARTCGIDTAKQFNTYTYQKLEETLQSNESLLELGYQGHGTNSPIAVRYDGYTTDFQNRTDNRTYFVGGGLDNGEMAVASFFDDVVLTHAPFPTVAQNGSLVQLNQNGNAEDTLDAAVHGANESAYTRIFVASDFSTDKAAKGEVRLVPNAQAAPALLVAGVGQVTTLDGSVISGTISATSHTWTADPATGLFTTSTDLGAEWKADYGLMLHGAALTPLQHWEADAEAVLENTAAAGLSTARQAQFRQDAQREFDAVWTAMGINQATLGISAIAPFTQHSYLMMEQTLHGNEPLQELAVQGHGLNGPVAAKYHGYTQDFQNRTDRATLYAGPGVDSGEKAIADFFDDVILNHAPFPTLLHDGHLIQLNQNGNREDPLATAIAAANEAMFISSLTPDDFSHPKPMPAKRA